jgi:hypothetical protein
MTTRDPARFRLYDLEYAASLPTRVGDDRAEQIEGSFSYLGRGFGMYRARIPAWDANGGPPRCALAIGLIEWRRNGAEMRGLLRTTTMLLFVERSGTAQRILEPANWPWQPLTFPYETIALSRKETLKSPRLQQYWDICAFLIEHDLSLKSALHPEPAQFVPPAIARPSGYRCGECGMWHEGKASAYSMQFPDLWFDVPREQWAQRVWLEGDSCTIDGRRFVRAQLRVPILDAPHPLDAWLWVELASEQYAQLIDRWRAPDRAADAPVHGRLGNEAAGFPGSLGLPCTLRFIEAGPLRITMMPCDHPLNSAQRNGISRASLLDLID